jgi:hypothetical protein
LLTIVAASAAGSIRQPVRDARAIATTCAPIALASRLLCCADAVSGLERIPDA